MSKRDVRDILEIGAGPSGSVGSSSTLAPPPPRRSRPTAGPPDGQKKRPDGITRELYALIGDNAPSLALAQGVKPKFKERIKKSSRSVKWQWISFTNPSRGAGQPESEDKGQEARKKLKLSHWVRDVAPDHAEGAIDTKFAKFNTTSMPYSYTDDEYTKYLRDESWTKEETDHLFKLAHEYDLRFIVMADRWDLPSQRGVDDLKARYYGACRSLVLNRPIPATAESTQEEKDKMEKSRQDSLASFQFDINRERERKTYLKSLLNRTPAQIAEEEFLYIESRRLEQSYNKMASERAELLKILGGREGIGAQGGVQIGVGGGVKGVSASGASREQERKRKGQTGWEIEGLNGGGMPEGWVGEGSKRKATAEQDIANCIERHPAPSVSAPKSSPWPSVSLRSSRVTAVKSGAANKVSLALAELGFKTILVMPTKSNIEKLDNLQATLVQMVELKKLTDRTDAEIMMYKKKKRALLGKTDGEDEEMDEVKKEEGLTEEERMRNKRSASASSTGTNKRARH